MLQRAIASVDKLGGWSIEEKLLNFIISNFSKGIRILEFGSGFGTSELLKYFDVISIEHDEQYNIKRSENHVCILAPLKDHWYDHNIAAQTMISHPFDLILVDGPPGDLREGILKNMHLFTHLTCPVIFDDVNRNVDEEIMIRLIKLSIRNNKRRKKGFCVLSKFWISLGKTYQIFQSHRWKLLEPGNNGYFVFIMKN